MIEGKEDVSQLYELASILTAEVESFQLLRFFFFSGDCVGDCLNENMSNLLEEAPELFRCNSQCLFLVVFPAAFLCKSFSFSS